MNISNLAEFTQNIYKLKYHFIIHSIFYYLIKQNKFWFVPANKKTLQKIARFFL